LHGQAAFMMVSLAGSSSALSRRRGSAASLLRHGHGCLHRGAGAGALCWPRDEL
jgi:hypothetical protein